MSYCGCHGVTGLELTAWKAPGDAGQRQVHGLNIFMKKELVIIPDKLGIYRLAGGETPPSSLIESGSFYCITASAEETSIVCREQYIPDNRPSEKGFIALKVAGPLDFSLTGVLSALLVPLTEAGISVFAISTYDTDYILVKEENLERAVKELSSTWQIRRQLD